MILLKAATLLAFLFILISGAALIAAPKLKSWMDRYRLKKSSQNLKNKLSNVLWLSKSSFQLPSSGFTCSFKSGDSFHPATFQVAFSSPFEGAFWVERNIESKIKARSPIKSQKLNQVSSNSLYVSCFETQQPPLEKLTRPETISAFEMAFELGAKALIINKGVLVITFPTSFAKRIDAAYLTQFDRKMQEIAQCLTG